MQKYSHEEIRERFQNFFESKYSADIMRIADNYPDEMSLYTPYQELVMFFGDDFPRFILNNPKRSFAIAEEVMLDIAGQEEKDMELHFRIIELPQPRNKTIRNLRAEDLAKFIGVDGLARKVTEVRPRLSVAAFQCLSCGEITYEHQKSQSMDVPSGCPNCGKESGKKAKFLHLLEESEFKNYQNIEIQESPEGLRGGDQPQRLRGWIEDDLVGRISPGDRITINGILDGTPKRGRGGTESRTFDIFMRVNSIEVKEYEYEEVELQKEDKEKIEEVGSNPRIFSKIVSSIAPSIYGLPMEKTGLALQLFGGVRKIMPDEQKIRGDIHVLLVGDPGTAKSQLLRYISDLSPRGMYTSGKGSTGAGLTAAAVREEVMGESRWILEAGTLVLADKGIAAVDELDKMRDEDRSSMHEAMEQQSISVAKAGINARLNSRCALLGAANPQYGRFEIHENISQQINLPPPLISRFDLIFALMDRPDKTKDKAIAEHILKTHQAGEELQNEPELEKEEKQYFSKDFLRKYIAYTKSISPIMTEESMDKLEDFYLNIRTSGSDSNTIPITARQLESLIRLSEASARAHLREKVVKEDAERAINVTEYFLRQVASTESGLDIDMVAAEYGSSERTLVHQLSDIIDELDRIHEGGVPEKEIIEEAEKKGYTRESVKKELSRMGNRGQIYSPIPGKYRKT